MPSLYITGTGADMKSCVVERRDFTSESDVFEALRLGPSVAALPEGTGESTLLESPTKPGGAVYNIYPWKPGQRTPMHRTITTDVDVVLHGSLIMELESESVELHAGDVAVLPGTAHAWVAGSAGAVVLYNLVAGAPTGSDVDRHRHPFG